MIILLCFRVSRDIWVILDNGFKLCNLGGRGIYVVSYLGFFYISSWVRRVEGWGKMSFCFRGGWMGRGY